jgi:hypothetical protein
MATKLSNWFELDRTGLSKILQRKGIEFAIFELVQNAWDERGVTQVDVELQADGQRGRCTLIVRDDAPDGFADLRHAYTLFAESKKKDNPEQRGRFNLGEKLVLSLCDWASIATTTGTIVFGAGGRSVKQSHKTDRGSIFEACIRMTKAEMLAVRIAFDQLIAPAGITTTFNGDALVERVPAYQFEASLPTEIANEDGDLRRTAVRKCVVNCYEVKTGETASIYEMGIPVVEHDCAWHVDVMQKVPLTLDRENVTGRFLKVLRTAVFNETHQSLDTEAVNHAWTQDAIESGDAKPEAVVDYMTKRFGDKRASYDPNDAEANNQAVAHGYTIVHGGMLSGAAWQNVKSADAIAPAGRLFPTHSDNTIDGEPAEETENMKRVRGYCQQLAELLMGIHVTVRFTKQPSRERACYGSRTISFNVRNLGGDKWFDLKTNRLAIDDLIIHEFGHEYAANHLSEAYNDALSRLAAKAMALGRAGKLPA